MDSQENPSRKVVPIAPVAATSAEAGDSTQEVISLYVAHQKIYPRSVQGLFAYWRWALVFITQIIFYGLPWLEWGQRQAVLFDLGARRFYIFGFVLYPQDFIYLTAILVISAFSLFLFTAVAGRLWCGYACPQTVYSEIFLWVERKIEGDRTARMKLDASGMSLEKLFKKWYKHIVWLGIAMWTGFTFVGYFTPIRDLGMEFFTGNMSSWEVFWVFFYALATYGNAGFMREQVCKYMCPYARFQSAMFDKDTLIVTYDEARGEPRGARSKKADHKALGLGACVDCSLCVQVCPTGIDIRKGLQYECIGCGACADVCDTVMEKVGYAKGLVKYSTQNAMAGGWSRVHVVRDRAALARIVSGGQIENVYRLQIMNAAEKPLHFKLSAEGAQGLQLVTENDVLMPATESRWISVRLHLPYDAAQPGSHPIHFHIQAYEEGKEVVDTLSEKSVFLVPR